MDLFSDRISGAESRRGVKVEPKVRFSRKRSVLSHEIGSTARYLYCEIPFPFRVTVSFASIVGFKRAAGGRRRVGSPTVRRAHILPGAIRAVVLAPVVARRKVRSSFHVLAGAMVLLALHRAVARHLLPRLVLIGHRYRLQELGSCRLKVPRFTCGPRQSRGHLTVHKRDRLPEIIPRYALLFNWLLRAN